MFLHQDLAITATYYMSNRDKNMFLSTSRKMYCLKTMVWFNEPVSYYGNTDVPYADRFTSMRDLHPSCANLLSKNVKKVTFSCIIGDIKAADRFLTHIEDIRFDNSSQQKSVMPLLPNIKRVTFAPSYNNSIENYFHPEIEFIHFGNEFNQPVDGLLPENVQEIIFGDNFNQPIKHFPSGLKRITFGYYFDKKIKYLLPEQIEYVKFGMKYVHSIENIFPHNTRCIKFGDKFNQPLDGHLPHGLKNIAFGKKFLNLTPNTIPNGVNKVKFGFVIKHSISGYIPSSVTHITLKFPNISHALIATMWELPQTVTHLKLARFEPRMYSNKYKTKLIDIPLNIPPWINNVTYQGLRFIVNQKQ